MTAQRAYVRIFRGDILPSGKEKDKNMQIPEWAKPAGWGAIVGAIVISMVGFQELGWKSSATAETMAVDRSDAAVVAALVPFCVTKAKADPDAATMAKFQAETSSYSRSDLVIKAGWATLGGQTTPDNAVGRACSDKLYAVK